MTKIGGVIYIAVCSGGQKLRTYQTQATYLDTYM